ncbi:ABC transporter family substrate-binding protein [Pseudonocardia phyllosphaerae]|uniref:ABC transporter family substrate-binding protein n=1 Tax=Pseudonocardia phyllosphaerae TaxID=3390502 RepID=UPI00397BC308
MRRPIRRGATTAAVAALALVMAACGGGDSGGQERTGEQLSTTPSFNEQPYENVKDGGQVTLPFRSDLNPQFNQFQGDATTDTRLAWSFYNPQVITFTPTGDPIINPDYVTEAKPVDSGGKTTVTYTINPKATFNDGTPIDWKAFDSTWKADNGKDPAFLPSSTDGYDRIVSVKRGANDKQAVVSFNGPNPWWPSLFNLLVHPKVATPDVFNKGYLNNPHPEWGAGPYMLTKFDKANSTLTFERNPKWWGKKGKLDRITLVQLETVAKVNAFRNGQIDAAEAESADLLAQAKTVPDADIRISGTPADYLLTLNSKAPTLKDPAVRKAIFDGIDRTQLTKIRFQGLDYSEAPSGSLVLAPFQKGFEDNVSSAVTFNPDAAKQALDAAGWAPGPDGIRAKNGQPLTFSFVQTGDTRACQKDRVWAGDPAG